MALPPSGQQKEAPQQRVSLHLPRDAPWAETLPKDYNLKLTSIDTKDAFVFTTPPQQDSVSSFAASVVHEATVTPIMNEEYKSIMKLRQEAESKKRKSVFVIGEKESRNLRRVQSTMGGNISGSITNISKAEAARVTGRFKDLEKRERMERQDLINILIMAFNEHEYWSFKDLGNRTKQPAAWLKEVLGDVAQIVKGGTYNGLYEIKAVLKDVGGSGEADGNDLDRKDEI
ncbi:transcription initiation factor IIF, beta subunit-domain-containing protein [Chytriomyces sp. MP71]|nr:transcription initiation factor IIF, beta subunit-domain-containing protein [Chytriomyces sp. MP71]